jgi:hypothetical protein
MGMGGAGPDVMPGNDPAAMGGDPAAAGGAGKDEISQIVALLEQLGISPEELEAAMAAEGGHGDAGGAPMGGEPMGEAAPDKANEAPGMEVEASAKRHVAKQATAKKGAANNLVRDYIQEILERSRH